MNQTIADPNVITVKAQAKPRAHPGRESQSLALAMDELLAIFYKLKSGHIINHEPTHRKVSGSKDS